MIRWRSLGGLLVFALVAWLVVVAVKITATARAPASGNADAAIVLGAAVSGDKPSPVFEQRIRHGVALYHAGRVRVLILTGGVGDGKQHAESVVARAYALRAGVPAAAIRIETRSRTTRANLVEANALMRAEGLRSAMIVSDPLHVARGLRMARDLGMEAAGAPTPTSMYRSWSTRTGFLLREVYYYNWYLLSGQ